MALIDQDKCDPIRSAIISQCAGATDCPGESNVEEYFGATSGEEDWAPRYNIAPTQQLPAMRQNREKPVRELSLMRSENNPRSEAIRVILTS